MDGRYPAEDLERFRDPDLALRLARILEAAFAHDGLPADAAAAIAAGGDVLIDWALEHAAVELLMAEAEGDPEP